MRPQLIKKSKESNVAAIKNDSAVTLHFTIKMKDGSVADSTENMGKPATHATNKKKVADSQIRKNMTETRCRIIKK